MNLITVGAEQFVRAGNDLINLHHVERISLDDRTVSLSSGYIAKFDSEQLEEALPTAAR